MPDFERLRPCLQRVILKQRSVLQERHKRIEHVHFIESGIVSLRAIANGTAVETAILGNRGVGEAGIACGVEQSLHQAVVLISGCALRVDIGDLRNAMAECPGIRERLLRFVEPLIVHSSQTALCGMRHDLHQRIACWLSLICDAAQCKNVPITQDHLSFILGARRPSVTEELARFEQLGLIAKTRGVLEILDREMLRQAACECLDIIGRSYGRAELISVRNTVPIPIENT